MGRPTKCTPEVTDALCALIRNGVGRESAARQVRIGVATFHRWMEKGRANIRPYKEFRRRIEEASDQLHVEISDVLLKGLRTEHLPTAVHTAEWLGERLFPHVYGKRQELRHSGPDGGPVAVAAEVTGRVAVGLFSAEQLANMAPEQIEAALRGLGATEGEP